MRFGLQAGHGLGGSDCPELSICFCCTDQTGTSLARPMTEFPDPSTRYQAVTSKRVTRAQNPTRQTTIRPLHRSVRRTDTLRRIFHAVERGPFSAVSPTSTEVYPVRNVEGATSHICPSCFTIPITRPVTACRRSNQCQKTLILGPCMLSRAFHETTRSRYHTAKSDSL